MWRLTEGGPKAPAEMGFGAVGDLRDRGDIERLGISAVHRVSRAEQPPVQILDLKAHAITLRDHPEEQRRSRLAGLRRRATSDLGRAH